jgi:hypothetical protein
MMRLFAIRDSYQWRATHPALRHKRVKDARGSMRATAAPQSEASRKKRLTTQRV